MDRKRSRELLVMLATNGRGYWWGYGARLSRVALALVRGVFRCEEMGVPPGWIVRGEEKTWIHLEGEGD